MLSSVVRKDDPEDGLFNDAFRFAAEALNLKDILETIKDKFPHPTQP